MWTRVHEQKHNNAITGRDRVSAVLEYFRASRSYAKQVAEGCRIPPKPYIYLYTYANQCFWGFKRDAFYIFKNLQQRNCLGLEQT